MNKVILTGNLTREPELRQTVSGKSRLAVGIAVKHKKKNGICYYGVDMIVESVEFAGSKDLGTPVADEDVYQ